MQTETNDLTENNNLTPSTSFEAINPTSIKVEETEYCKLNIKYETADKDQIDAKRTEVVSYFKKAPVPGCRPGKAHLEAIKVHYRNQINESLKRALAEQAFHNTIFEKNIKPFGTPEFNSILLLGNKFTCEFSMYKKPDFELATYKELELPKPPTDLTSNEFAQNMLQELRVRFGESVPFTETDFVQKNDNVIIDYDAIDGETKLDSLCTKGEILTVGRSQLHGFDDNLLGMKVGETRDFTLLIPETGLPSVAGKQIKFVTTLVMGSKINPMPLNDELAKKMNKENFAQLEEYVNGVATAKISEAQRSAQTTQLSNRLVADNDIKVPDWLTLSEAKYLAANAKLTWDEMVDEDRNKFLETANSNVKLSLILDKIRELEPEAQLSDQEVLDMIKQTLSRSGQNPDETLATMNQNGYLSVLTARIRDEQTLDFVLKNSKIIE